MGVVWKARDAKLGREIAIKVLETGQRRLGKEIPLDRAISVFQPRMTPDGNAWAYWGRRILSELYLVEGLR